MTKEEARREIENRGVAEAILGGWVNWEKIDDPELSDLCRHFEDACGDIEDYLGLR